MFRRRNTPEENEFINSQWLEEDFLGLEEERDSGCRFPVLGLLMSIAATLLLTAGAVWFWNARGTASVDEQLQSPAVVDEAIERSKPTVSIPTPTPTAPLPTATVVSDEPNVLPAESGIVDTTPQGAPFDPEIFAGYMLQLINRDRAAEGLEPVQWDRKAADVARLHAEDMLANGYFSHWNLQGLGPDHRYSLAGGEHAVFENLHLSREYYSDGSGVPIEDWLVVVENAQKGLMNSPGHRLNILDPAHTHVGIGMAYDPSTGFFLLAQEFTNQYVALGSAIPLYAEAGDEIEVSGYVDNPDISRLLLELAFEPAPTALSVEEVNARDSYSSASSTVDGSTLELVFSRSVILPQNGGPGIYHIRIYGDLNGEQALLLSRAIFME